MRVCGETKDVPVGLTVETLEMPGVSLRDRLSKHCTSKDPVLLNPISPPVTQPSAPVPWQHCVTVFLFCQNNEGVIRLWFVSRELCVLNVNFPFAFTHPWVSTVFHEKDQVKCCVVRITISYGLYWVNSILYLAVQYRRWIPLCVTKKIVLIWES